MKILAGSIQGIAETFLHPGYISAIPRHIDAASYEPSPDSIDLVEAFRLTEATVANTPGINEHSASLSTTASLSGWSVLLYVALCTIGLLSASYVLRHFVGRSELNLRKMVLIPVTALMAISLILISCGGQITQSQPATTWEIIENRQYSNFENRQYLNPELATYALLHGIIADGIVNTPIPVRTLSDIRPEVGLPITNLTEGQAYALQNYEDDGWGREFRVSEHPEESLNFRVTSAGADGTFDTSDDIQIGVSRYELFEENRQAFYVRKIEDQYYVFFHRALGEDFRYCHRETAVSLTGTELFDVWVQDDLTRRQMLERARSAYNSVAQNVDYEPLILQPANPHWQI